MATELPETLLSDSTVWLFGRVMTDISITPKEDDYRLSFSGPGLNRGSANNLLARQLLAPGPASPGSIPSLSRTRPSISSRRHCFSSMARGRPA